MQSMRRSDRQITDPTDICAILDATKVCRLAMVDEAGVYIVPLNFGYTLDAPTRLGDIPVHHTEGLPSPLTLYVHSASTGRKIAALQQNPRVCFEMDGAHALIDSDIMTEFTYHYESIIGTGTAHFVTDPTARMDAMVAIMRQQTGLPEAEIRAMPYEAKWMGTDRMAVIAITVDTLTAKRHH